MSSYIIQANYFIVSQMYMVLFKIQNRDIIFFSWESLH